jgi:hypothetical protein
MKIKFKNNFNETNKKSKYITFKKTANIFGKQNEEVNFLGMQNNNESPVLNVKRL